MELRILGPLEVRDANGPVPLPRGRGRALLALLALRVGEVVSTGRLIDELWGEAPPPTATTALQGLVSHLRKRTSGLIETRPPGYVLAADPDDVDANRFRRLLRDAAGASAERKAALLRQALGLWRGPALAEFSYEPFAQTTIAALDELRLSAIEERIDADLVLGRSGELIGELESLVVEHPLRERLCGQLMLALYRAGRQAEALGVYRKARAALVEELGIEPGPDLQRLEQAILRQDSSLIRLPDSLVRLPDRDEVSRQWLGGGRKTVTVAVVGFAETSETLDVEALQPVVKEYADTAADVFTRHGGRVERFIGDAVVGVFGAPTAHEDDALRAVRAAAELHRTVRARDEQLLRDRQVRIVVRTGIDTGEALLGHPSADRAIATGEVFNRAARLRQVAAEDEVLISEATRQLVRDAVLLDAVAGVGLGRAWRLRDVIPGATGVSRSFGAPMVGRVSELAALDAALAQAVREGRARMVTVVGEAGIGKSKLALEFAAARGSEALVLTGHCPAYGEGITFWPLREIVQQATGGAGRDGLVRLLAGQDDPESIADQIAAAVGLTDATVRADRLFPGLRCFIERLAARRPVVMVLEDVHWAQPTVLDFVEYLIQWTRGAVFVLCLARPELLEERPTWPVKSRTAASLFLEPLDAEATQRLVSDRLAGRTLPPETLARIVRTSQGNPLFAEQLTAALAHGEQVPIPASVEALLAARLDRLGPAERDVIRCASVAGFEFSPRALAAVLPEQARPFVGRHLAALESKELIRPSRQASAARDGFTFRHVLIQLAAYRSLTRQLRARLHERYADWLDQGSAPGLEEIVGYHLEQAYVHRRELGLLDAHSAALAVRAGERLVSAGRRAYGRFDVTGAENLWSRAIALLPVEHAARSAIMLHLAETYQVLGRHDDADVTLAAVQEVDNPDLDQAIKVERARIRLITGPEPLTLGAIRETAEGALAGFGRSGNEAGAATACYVLWLTHYRLGEVGEMEEFARRGLGHAERSGTSREQMAARLTVAETLLWGETPVPDCLRECAELARWRGTEHPLVLTTLAELRAMRGDFPEARELIARSRRLLVERFRARRPRMFAARSSAIVERLAGDLPAAEREFRLAVSMANEMGEREQASQFAAALSRILSMRGSEEADRFWAISVETAPAEHVPTHCLGAAAQARVLASRGEHPEAERSAREALRLAPRDMLNLRGDVLMDLADVLRAAGRGEAATPVVQEATDLYRRKGNIVATAWARQFLPGSEDALAGDVSASVDGDPTGAGT